MGKRDVGHFGLGRFGQPFWGARTFRTLGFFFLILKYVSVL